MRKLGAVGPILVLAGFGLFGCDRAQGRAGASVPAAEPNSLEGVPLNELPRVVRERYRLQPDRRLLDAVGVISRLTTAKAPCAVSAAPEGESWRIACDDQLVGTLPDLPDFENGTRLLVAWARRTMPAGGGTPVDSAQVAAAERSFVAQDPVATLEALTSFDQYFPAASRDPAVLRAATRGYLALQRLTYDALKQADALGATTWALLALSLASDDRETVETEALVAEALGYEAAAAAAARKLADDRPAKWFVLADGQRLAQTCAATKLSDCETFAQIVAAGEAAAEATPVDSLDALGLVLAAHHQGNRSGREIGPRLAREAALAVGAVAKDDSPDAVAGASRRFEAAVTKLGRSFPGPLLPGEVAAAFYRANFYGGLHRFANHGIEHLGSGPAARHLAASMGDAAPGTAAELQRWIRTRADVEDGSQEVLPIVNGVLEMKSIGSWPLVRIVYTVFRSTATTDPLRRRPVPAAFARLDSRPSDLEPAARMARNNLESPVLFERYARVAAARRPYGSGELPALAALFDEDAARLREIAGDPRMGGYTREVAVFALHELGHQDPASMRAFYEALVTSDPEAGSLDGLVDFLERAGDLPAAVAAVESVLRRDPDRRDLLAAHWRTKLAHLLAAQGKLDEAWAAIAPAVETWKNETLDEAASIQLRQGRIEEGLELARAALSRYPDDEEASALIVQAHWQEGDFAGAAKELTENRNGLVKDWTALLPRVFADAFATASDDEVRKAFEELTRTTIAPHILSDMALELGERGKLDLALELVEGLRDPRPEWQSSMRIRAYDLVAEKRGEAEALAWFQKSPSVRTHSLALTLFQMKKYELLWGLFPTGSEGGKPRIVRLLKAAALVHLGERSSERRDALRAAVEGDPDPNDFFVRAARYLLGSGDSSALAGSPPYNLEQIANISWAFGMGALAENRLHDAEAWFQVVQETGQQSLPPHAWAWITLSDWLQTRRSLERLQGRAAS